MLMSKNNRNMHKPKSVLENKTRKILCDFEIQTDPSQSWVNKTCRLVDFHVLADQRENKRIHPHRHKNKIEFKKLWNMRVAVTTIVNGALGTVPKRLGKKRLEEFKIGGGIKTIQIIALLRMARILRRVLLS